MSDLDLIRDASNLAFRLRGEDAPVFSDLVPDWNYSDEDVARLWIIADQWRLAVDQMAQALGAEWVERWRQRGNRGMKVDGFLVTTKKGSISERCIDSEGFWRWAATVETDVLQRVFNENTARKGSMPPSVRDTFFEKTQTVKPDAVRQASAIPLEVLDG